MLPLLGKLILFTDNMTLLESHKNKRFLKYAASHDLNLMMDWFRANKLSLNIAKTVAIHFSSTDNNTSLHLAINDVQIPRVDITKFLEVYLNKELNWKYYANQVYNKLQSNKQLLSMSKNILDVTTLVKIYYAHIYSHLSYGLVVWGSMLDERTKGSIFTAKKECIQLL